jgi:hypothetical protein
MGLVNYAATTDVAAQLSEVGNPTDYTAIWNLLLSVASRGIDGLTDRFFYNDAPSTKYFDGDGTATLLVYPDFYSPTAIKIASFENADPTTSDYVQLTGDGVTPPSDFFLDPANQYYVGKAGDSNHRPFTRVSIPATSPATSSTFQSVFMPGKRTVAVTASWGWPAVPDEIFQMTVKLVIRMWKSGSAGYTGLSGDPEFGPRLPIANFLDSTDLYTLGRYQRYSASF